MRILSGVWLRLVESEVSASRFASNFANSVAEWAQVFSNESLSLSEPDAAKKTRRVMLAPYGDWPNQRGLQRFQKEDAQNIVNEFESIGKRALNPSSWLGLPWYEGHPDHPDFRGKAGHTRSTAVGRIKSLEAGNDGLYANVKFNDDGESLIRNESYHGHSVNWFLNAGRNGDTGKYRPFKLKSVGFTNEPNIPVPAVTTANGAPLGNKNAAGEHDLKNEDGWHTFAPGTGAHDQNANSFQKELPGGHLRGDTVQYNINPLAKRKGFSLSSAGHPDSPGLWKEHGTFNTHRQAMASAHEHYNSTIGKRQSANSTPDDVALRYRHMAKLRANGLAANGAPTGNKNAAGHRGSAVERALGLQPGEAYGADEEAFSRETKHSHKGHPFDVYYDENAGALSQWKAWSKGIGTHSHMNREDVIKGMRGKIEAHLSKGSANSLAANTWSDAARKAALEARRSKSKSAEYATQAAMQYVGGNPADSERLHRNAAKAHGDAAAVYEEHRQAGVGDAGTAHREKEKYHSERADHYKNKPGGFTPQPSRHQTMARMRSDRKQDKKIDEALEETRQAAEGKGLKFKKTWEPSEAFKASMREKFGPK